MSLLLPPPVEQVARAGVVAPGLQGEGIYVGNTAE